MNTVPSASVVDLTEQRLQLVGLGRDVWGVVSLWSVWEEPRLGARAHLRTHLVPDGAAVRRLTDPQSLSGLRGIPVLLRGAWPGTTHCQNR
jgi:hypothetical protein